MVEEDPLGNNKTPSDNSSSSSDDNESPLESSDSTLGILILVGSCVAVVLLITAVYLAWKKKVEAAKIHHVEDEEDNAGVRKRNVDNM